MRGTCGIWLIMSRCNERLNSAGLTCRHGAAVLVVIVVLVLTNLANHYWSSQQYLFTCPVAAVLLVGVGRLAGLSWTELGMGRHALLHGILWAAGSVLVVAAGYSIALTIPGLRLVTGDAPTTREALFVALIEAPFATVLLEETAFRGGAAGSARPRPRTLDRHDHVVATTEPPSSKAQVRSRTGAEVITIKEFPET